MTDANGEAGEDTPQMVPITREFLRRLYARYPDPELSAQFDAARKQVCALTCLPEIDAPPHRMDECMYAARCACEEAGLVSVAQSLATFQDRQRAHVSAMITRFLPDDFRGWLFETTRAQSEARNKAAVDELVRNGGTVRDKYDLLWKQQWARRETLSMVGNATGVWKLAVRYIVGVPQPLIDFAKQINTPDGPTEELRVKFGPTLQRIVTFSRELAALKAVVEEGTVDKLPECREAVEKGAVVLQSETEKFCELLTKAVEESPFFVSSDDIDKLKKESASKK